MTSDVPTPDWVGLGAALTARREAREMTRADVEAAGGPSQATLQRIEHGRLRRGVSPRTKKALEQALELPDGWIDSYLAGRLADEQSRPVVIEGNFERVLVALTEGMPKLSPDEIEAVLAVVRAFDKGPKQ